MVKRTMDMVFCDSSKKTRYCGDMEVSSPFCQTSVFSIYLEPILNPYWKTYHEILTLSSVPPGPLNAMVLNIDFPRLSPFRANSGPFFNGHSCVPCVMRYPTCSIGGSGAAFRDQSSFMAIQDISALFSYLTEQGYVVEQGLTTMLFQGDINADNRKLVAMVRYNEPT